LSLNFFSSKLREQVRKIPSAQKMNGHGYGICRIRSRVIPNNNKVATRNAVSKILGTRGDILAVATSVFGVPKLALPYDLSLS
jgi:hypothetical protein